MTEIFNRARRSTILATGAIMGFLVKRSSAATQPGPVTDENAVNLSQTTGMKQFLASLASGTGSALIGFVQNGTNSVKRTVQGKLRETVSIFDFIPETEHAAILNRTSTYDCADAIENAQEHLSPFPWRGSVRATKSGITGARSKLQFPGGLYIIKRPVKLNPYIEFSGPFSGSFLTSGGAEIRADFDGRNLFAFDTAPWDSNGRRELGKAWTSADFDNVTITGCMGQRISKIRITCAKGRNIKGGINVTGAAPFFLEGSTIEGFNIGIRETCSWAGVIQGNFIKARAIGIWVIGTNAIKSRDNYFGPTGAKPSATEFDWPNATVSGYDQVTQAFYMDQGYITSDSDTIESWDVAYITTVCTTFRAVNMYLEDIRKACFVLHDTQGFIQPAKINCRLAKLYDVNGKGRVKEVEFILTALRSGSFKIGALGTASNCGVSITGSPDVTEFQPAGVQVPEFDYPNLLNIYVSHTSGNDLNAGYHPSYPVKELMTALSRCRKGCANVIHVTGDLVTNVVEKNDWTTFFSDLNIRFVKVGAVSTILLKRDSATGRMIPLSFENCAVTFDGFQFLDDVPTTAVAAGYRAAFNFSGINEMRFTGCTFKTAKPILQAAKSSAAKVSLFISRTRLSSYDGMTATTLIETDATSSGKLIWEEVGFEVTKTAISMGSNTNNVKLAATDF